ncbi:NLI interacting factor-like phosphatase [Pseudohyphozyma bogoriensis]|nr:NLI interacting factor-like phosphatase [Pseudohyphozyma bogoriensis]
MNTFSYFFSPSSTRTPPSTPPLTSGPTDAAAAASSQPALASSPSSSTTTTTTDDASGDESDEPNEEAGETIYLSARRVSRGADGEGGKVQWRVGVARGGGSVAETAAATVPAGRAEAVDENTAIGGEPLGRRESTKKKKVVTVAPESVPLPSSPVLSPSPSAHSTATLKNPASVKEPEDASETMLGEKLLLLRQGASPPSTSTTTTLDSDLDEKAMLKSSLANSTSPHPPTQTQQQRRWFLHRLTLHLYFLFRHLLSYVGLPAPAPFPTTPQPDPEKTPLLSSPPSSLPTPLLTPTSTPTNDTPAPAVPKPPRPMLTPKTLVLDLDETLIHSTSRPYPRRGKGGKAGQLKVRLVEVVLDGRSTVYTVYKRPWVDFFLRKVSAWYTVIIFTASLPEYADPVIDWLDGGDGGGGMVGGRLFRSVSRSSAAGFLLGVVELVRKWAGWDCRHSNGSYVKDLSVVDADLSRVCLVDNSPASYAINQANGIPIEGWINDPDDECLLDLLPMLDSLRFTSDVRRVLGLRGFQGGLGGGPRASRPVVA